MPNNNDHKNPFKAPGFRTILLGKTTIQWSRIGFTLLAGVLVMTLLAYKTVHSASQDSFPKKKITWIVPYGPGGGYDTYSRAIVRVMPKYLPKKVNVIVRNITGAGGMTAVHTLFRSKPDGHTIGILNLQAMALYAALGKQALDPSTLSYLGAAARDPGCILVTANSPFNTLADLQGADKVKFSATGPPSASWIVPKLAKEIMNINTEVVTGYSGSSGYMTGLIRGEVDAGHMGVYSGMPYIEAGETKAIIVYRETDMLPGVPIIKKGSPYEDMRLLGEDRVVAGPPGIPREIHDILVNAFMKSIKDPETQAWSKKTGYLFADDFSDKDVLELSKQLIRFYKKYKAVLAF